MIFRKNLAGLITDVSKNVMIAEYNNSEMKNLSRGKDIEKELLKLQEYNIIKYPETIEDAEESTMLLIERSYNAQESIYTFNDIEFTINKNLYKFEVENKSGKILFISLDKNYLNTDVSKEQIMRNYVNYLDLHIIDDWKLEDGMLKSEKAGLVVNLVQSAKNDICILSIRTIEKYYEITDSSNIKVVTAEKAKN